LFKMLIKNSLLFFGLFFHLSMMITKNLALSFNQSVERVLSSK